jgi:acyl-CoA thioester hydrolase
MKNKLPFNSIIPIQVRFNDVDMLGHVSNTVYQNYYDAGKLHYFEEVLPDMDFVKIGVIAASVKIDYLKPIFMKTRILVETHVVYIGTKSLTMEHQLVEEITGEVLSTCSVVLVCYDFKEQLSIPIPDEWKKQIVLYDRNVVVKS